MAVRLYVYDEDQCDPKKCTGKKLVRFNLAQEIGALKRAPYGAIVLTPFSEKSISREDRDAAEKHGLLVMDMSWNQIDTFPPLRRDLRQRSLPYMLAANPVNWGKPFKLSSVEALAGALYVMGYKEQAVKTLSKFAWGEQFLKLNQEPLDRYSEAETSAEVCASRWSMCPPSGPRNRADDVDIRSPRGKLDKASGRGLIAMRKVMARAADEAKISLNRHQGIAESSAARLS